MVRSEPGDSIGDGGQSGSATRRTVRDTFEKIAPHFARTRPEPWPDVAAFVREGGGAVGLDIGVGNGRHAELLAEVCPVVIGIDASHAALHVARDRSSTRAFELELVAADAVSLPVRDDSVDVGVYVATIHHLPTRRLRLASLDELARVVRPGGRAIVSAWSVSHERFDAEEGFDTTVDWTLPDGETVERFYHIYDRDEFARDVDASALARAAVNVYESSGNCYAVVDPEGKRPYADAE